MPKSLRIAAALVASLFVIGGCAPKTAHVNVPEAPTSCAVLTCAPGTRCVVGESYPPAAHCVPAAQPAVVNPVRTDDTVDARPAQRREPVTFVGELELTLSDKHGRVKDRRHLKNLVVDAGKAAVAGLIIATGHTNAFDHIAIGTGTTAAAAGNTACETEIASGGGTRALATLSRVTTDVTNDTAQAEVTYNFTSSFAVTESCLLDSITTGVLLSRQVFSAINVANGDSLLIRWKIDVD